MLVARKVDPTLGRYLEASAVVMKVAAIPNVLKTPAPSVAILNFNPLGTVLAVRPHCHNDHYWQVFFDATRAINDVGGEAGYPAPETRMAVRNA
jgi:small conductance mechanosensitive channel